MKWVHNTHTKHTSCLLLYLFFLSLLIFYSFSIHTSLFLDTFIRASGAAHNTPLKNTRTLNYFISLTMTSLDKVPHSNHLQCKTEKLKEQMLKCSLPGILTQLLCSHLPKMFCVTVSLNEGESKIGIKM